MKSVWHLLLIKAEAQAADCRAQLATLNAQSAAVEANREHLEQLTERYLTALSKARNGSHFVSDVAVYQRFVAQVQDLLGDVVREAALLEAQTEKSLERFRLAESERLKASQLVERDEARRRREFESREQRRLDALALLRFNHAGSGSWDEGDQWKAQ